MKKNSLKFCEETIAQKKQLEIAWIELAKKLKEIRDEEMYLGRWENFEDFLQDPSMGMDKSTASKMITIYEKLVVGYKMKPEKIAEAGGWSVIAEVLPVITDKESAEEWVDQCAHLSKNDVRKEVQRVRGCDESGDCKHAQTYQITLCCCRKCGNKEIIKTNE